MTNKTRALLRKISTYTVSPPPLTSANQIIPMEDPPLKYKVIAECQTTKARVGLMTLRHGEVDTPVFMPVGTQVCNAELFENLKTAYKHCCSSFPGHFERIVARAVVQPRLPDNFSEYVPSWHKTGAVFLFLRLHCELNKNNYDFCCIYRGHKFLMKSAACTSL